MDNNKQEEEQSPKAKRQQKHRKKNVIVRSIFKKMMCWFVRGYFPPHLKDKFTSQFTPKELAVFKRQYDIERHNQQLQQRETNP